MLGFLLKLTAGTVKLGVKYIVLPALVTVAVAWAAEAAAERIREHTPGHDGMGRRPHRMVAAAAD